MLWSHDVCAGFGGFFWLLLGYVPDMERRGEGGSAIADLLLSSVGTTRRVDGYRILLLVADMLFLPIALSHKAFVLFQFVLHV